MNYDWQKDLDEVKAAHGPDSVNAQRMQGSKAVAAKKPGEKGQKLAGAFKDYKRGGQEIVAPAEQRKDRFA